MPEDSIVLITDPYGSTINQAMGQVLPPLRDLIVLVSLRWFKQDHCGLIGAVLLHNRMELLFEGLGNTCGRLNDVQVERHRTAVSKNSGHKRLLCSLDSHCTGLTDASHDMGWDRRGNSNW